MTRIILAVFLFVSGTSDVAGQAPPAGSLTLARDVAAAINSGDLKSTTSFLRARLSPSLLDTATVSRYAALLHALYRQSGGITVRGTESFGAGVAVTLWARNADRGVILYVAPDRTDTTRLARVSALRYLHPKATVRPLPGVRAGDTTFAVALGRELSRLTAAGEFAGTVVVARGDTILFERGFGRSARPAGELNGPETRYHLASVGKMFTATAIAQLVEAGKLSFNDSLGTLLPGFPWAPASRAITVRQLLSHTSGLGQSERAGEAIDSAFAATPGAFAPGSRFAYSNDGYEILGLIIGRISGQPYAEYVRRQIYQRAGMRSTDDYPAEKPLAHRATGYGHRDGDYFGAEPLVPNTDKVKGRGSAAGGSFGTARDLVRFGRALLEGKLLQRATLDSLTLPLWILPGPYPDTHYGYGFETYDMNGTRIIGHGGGGLGWGICARLALLPERSYSVAVLSNVDPPECEDVARAIVAALTAPPE